MKENQLLKITLIIFLLIIIIIIGFYIYKIVNANKNILQNEDAEEMAKKILNEYSKLSNYENNNVGPMPYILVELGLETEGNINLLTSETDNTTVYIKSNTKYEEFKEKLLQYVTEDYFLKNFSQYKNIDGYVGFCNCAAGTIPVEVENITLSSINGNLYSFDVVFKDMEVYEHYLNPEDGENITEDDYLFNTEICFEYVNNKLVIAKVALDNNRY